MRPSRKGTTLTKGIAIRRPVGATPKNGPRMVPRNTPHATRTSVPKASPSCIISASGKAWKRAAYCAAICACPSKRTPRATFSMKPSGWQVAAAAAHEQGEVGLQAGRAGWEAEGHAGPAEIALVSAEVELHEGAGWQPSRALERERDAQEARLEDRDARAEPVARAELDLVVD